MGRLGLLALVGVCTALPAAAQAPPRLEVGLASAALFADPEFFGGGGVVALRPGGRLRLQLAALAGDANGLALRGELSGQFLLSPSRTRGIGCYGFAGIAGVAGPADAGYLLLGLGVEAAPGSSNGWWMEAGVGGGARIAFGWRWRSLGGGARGQP